MAPASAIPAESVSKGIMEDLPPSYVKHDNERPKVPYNVFCHDIPVISLKNCHGPELERQRVKDQLKRACEEWGIFQIVEHGVPKDLTTRIMNEARAFFSLPFELKSQYAMKPGTYVGYGKGSFIKDDPFLDWRELYVTRCWPRDTNIIQQWPSNPTNMRRAMEDYSNAMLDLTILLLELMSEALGLNSKAIENACGGGDQKLLLNYYPKCPRPDLTLGLKRHTDPGTITLLLQDHVGGLQATKDNGKTWYTVPPIDGAFVVNLGDQMHVLSNGMFKSADHQAVVNSNAQRLSVVIFHNPNPDSVVYPLDGLVGKDQSSKFERYIFKEFYARKMTKHIKEKEKEKEITTVSEGKKEGICSSE